METAHFSVRRMSFKEYQVLFWSVGSALLIVVVLGYYVFDNRNKLNFLVNKFGKIEESLNIYDRLTKLEMNMSKMKKAQINLLDIIKLGLAAILIYAFIKAIRGMWPAEIAFYNFFFNIQYGEKKRC